MGKRPVRRLDVKRSLKHCPACDYADGFHVRFARSGEKEPRFRMLLICPMCGEQFDMGLKVMADPADPAQ